MEKNEEINFAISYLVETWNDLSTYLVNNPEKLINAQLSYIQDYQKLFQDTTEDNPGKDKRFRHHDWQNNIILNFVKKSYLLLSNHVENLIDGIDEKENEKIAKKIRFFTRQFLDAISPTNFAHINPEVLEKIAETNGDNIRDGFKQFLEDIKQGKGKLNIKMTDLDIFKLGENIACTKGKIVYQNDLMQLIQYAPTTNTAHEVPLLITPPWINKYYILDLQQENSLVKWLVDQGITVFMISWVNPSSEHKDKDFVDYMREGPLSALKIMKKITGKKRVNALGYCIGGTLLGCTLAYLSKKQDTSVLSATFLTSLLDFSDPGELGVFIDEEQIQLLEKNMNASGYLDGRTMATVFNALRANDLIWASFVDNYLKSQKPKPFDLLYWNSDSTNIPAKVHSFYLRKMYLENSLIQKDIIRIDGIPLDLGEIRLPTYFLAAQDDHIVPWTTCYKSSQFVNGKMKFVLTTSGHVAGVINPPQKKKYGYYTNNKKVKTHEKFLENATFTEGSWWNDWLVWLKQYSGAQQALIQKDQKKWEILDDAPGSYVKVRLASCPKEESIKE